jgi:hypothetical protein
MITLFKKLSMNKDVLIRLGYLTESFIVMLILVLTYCLGITNVPFHGDESQWIATSYYFDALFNSDLILPSLSLNGERNNLPSNLIWGENYWTLTQPPVTRYIIALGRLSGGYQANDLNPAYEWSLYLAENEALGAIPSPRLLWWSRLPMAILAAVSGMILFLLVRNCAGRMSGYAFVVLFVNTPYFLIQLRRAMGESPLLFFTVLTIVAGGCALVKWGRIRQTGQSYTSLKSLLSPFLWLILLGIGAGLAGATKLNGLVLSLAGVLICYLIFQGSKRIVSRTVRVSFLIRTSVLLMLVAGIVFVIINPYLYPNPLGRTAVMIKFRYLEMEVQKISFPGSISPEIGTRLMIVSQRIFKDYMVLNFKGAWIVNVLLFGLGASYLVRTGLQWLMNKGGSSISVAILVVASVIALPSLFTPLDWDRYYLFPVIFVSFFIAIGIGMSLTFVCRWLWFYFKYLKERYRIYH